MNIYGLGLDMVNSNRIKDIIKKNKKFEKKIFSKEEISFCENKKNKFSCLAKRFAAKEAVMKALGTGVRGVGWKDIEIKRERGGPPYIELHGRAQTRASKMDLSDISISLSHSNDFAIATVVGEATAGNRLPR